MIDLSLNWEQDMSRDSTRSKNYLELVGKRILKSSNLMRVLHLEECLHIEEFS